MSDENGYSTDYRYIKIGYSACCKKKRFFSYNDFFDIYIDRSDSMKIHMFINMLLDCCNFKRRKLSFSPIKSTNLR